MATDNNPSYHAHFDCFSGAAGDMLLAACIDAAATAASSATSSSSSSDGIPSLSVYETNVQMVVQHIKTCIIKGIPELENEFDICTSVVQKGGIGSIRALYVNVTSIYNHEPAPVPTDDDTNHNVVDSSAGTSLPIVDHSSTINGNHHRENELHQHQHSHGHDHDDHHDHQSHHHHHSHDHNHQRHPHHEHNHDHHHVNPSQLDPLLASSSSPSSTMDPHPKKNTPMNHNKLRNLPEIKRLLQNAASTTTTTTTPYISSWVCTMGMYTFTELAIAEAQVHGCSSVDAVHFHEVGAIDSIVDILGTFIVLHDILQIRTVSCSRLPMGYGGSVYTQHGYMPIPAPATLLLLQDMPTCASPYPTNKGMNSHTILSRTTGELVTPTGVAVLKTLTKHCSPYTSTAMDVSKNSTSNHNSQHHPQQQRQQHSQRYPYGDGTPPAFTIRKIGIGAGTKEFQDHPNILRIIIGDDIVL
jgi:uncharacterized protein (DUF111 family)